MRRLGWAAAGLGLPGLGLFASIANADANGRSPTASALRATSVSKPASVGPSTPSAASGTSAHQGAEQHVYHVLDEQKAVLRQVQVVFRHGARTPLTDNAELWKGHVWDVCGSAYEGVPMDVRDVRGGPAPECEGDKRQVSKKLEGGCHKGELTRVGQWQALALGRWMRRRYVEGLSFLPADQQTGAVSSRTTNYQRTLATLRGVLTGLYPDASTPFPVVTSDQFDEVLFADSKTCPHLGTFIQAAKAMLKEQAGHPSRAPIVTQLCDALGLEPAFFGRHWHFSHIHDAMTSLATHGKALPPGMTPALLREVDRLATKEFSAIVAPSLKDEHGHTILALSSGRLVDILLDNMDSALAAGTSKSGSGSNVSGSSSSGSGSAANAPPRVHLFSGHDSTIMPLLAAMGTDVEEWPPYLSNFVFELWEVQPPAAPVAASASGREAPNSAAPEVTAADPEQRFAVKVWFNQAEFVLPGTPAGHHMSYSTFKSAVLAPFVLSQADHAQACKVHLRHDGSLPTPGDADED